MLPTTFDYAPGDQVKTCFGDIGFVDSCLYARGGQISYYIIRTENNLWLHADQLQPAPAADA